MASDNPLDVKRWLNRRHSAAWWLMEGLILLLLACNAGIPLINNPTPTPTSGITRFEVQIERPASPTPILFEVTPAPTVITPTITPLATLSGEENSTLEALPTTVVEPTPTQLPTLPPLSSPTLTGTTVLTEPVGEGIYTGNITDQIVLLGPDPGYTLPLEMDQLEFKWKWLGDEVRPCELPEGFGFEVRIWPSPANAQIPEDQRKTIEPLGVIDAVADQTQIAANCDIKTETRRYTVNYLKSTPGVMLAKGSGHFFWDVVYIQVEPYYVQLMVSAPQDFFIPPVETDQPGPTATPTATPLFQLTPDPRPAGTITLVTPEGKPTFPANIGPVEFRWKWEGEGTGPCALIDGYGFELRIGSTQPGMSRLGLFDAVTGQEQISCDPGTGIYSYRAFDLKNTPGVKATYVGDYRWDGQFVWDVALVSTRPYQIPDPESVSPPGFFAISLDEYTGAFDPFGEPLKCREFSGWTEAQAVFLAAGGPGKDPHELDKDGNQIACDELRQ